ncbi:NAD(P)H oxidase [Bertholletia excelsa]
MESPSLSVSAREDHRTAAWFSPVQKEFPASCLFYLQRNELRCEGGGEETWATVGRLRSVGNGVNTEELRWEIVEERFDRLARTSPGSVPVVSAVDFCYCIGMQNTPEFAKEFLRALRGRKAKGAEITKAELHKHWLLLTNPCFNSREQIFFQLSDRSMDGRLTHQEIKQAILSSASFNKLFMTQKEAEQYAYLIMEELGTENHGYVKVSQLETLFKSGHFPADLRPSISVPEDPNQWPLSKAEILFRTRWRRTWMVTFWLIVCFGLFAWKFVQYSHREAFKVMGYCLSTAKGAAETLKFNMAIILLPVSRNTLTWLRKSRLISSIIPFNDNINFHKMVAGGIVIGVILHGGTHLACDFPRISSCDSSIFQRTIASRFGYNQPSYTEILATAEVLTGIAMVVLMAIAFSLATKWPRRQSPSLPRSIRRVTGFNTFWYSHHLFVLVYALLIVHSMFLFLTNKVAEKTTWMYIAIPVLLYSGERFFRAIRSALREIKVLKATLYPGKVVSLKLSKPEGFRCRSGMYIYIQCPQISPFEWHPFSLTSGPGDDHLSVHIRAVGDWSYQIYSLFQEAIVSAGTLEYPRIQIDGPYGAASQDHVKYDIALFIGLGIGVTPFISIVKDIISHLRAQIHDHKCRESGATTTKCPSKAYLCWVTREQYSFEWFRDVIRDISNMNQKQDVIEMHSFLTRMYEGGDARSALLGAVQALHFARTGIDIFSRSQVQTHFGRPNWLRIFSNMSHRHGRARIGVFYCGPQKLARELERLCTKFSSESTTRFVFHKENY